MARRQINISVVLNTDIKECELNLDDCDSADDHAICIEESGSYRCECRPPYEGDGHVCLRK